MSDEIAPTYTLTPHSEPPLAVIKTDGTIELADGMTLDETIAALWAWHETAPPAPDASFHAAMALLEVRALAAGIADTETPQ